MESKLAQSCEGGHLQVVSGRDGRTYVLLRSCGAVWSKLVTHYASFMDVMRRDILMLMLVPCLFYSSPPCTPMTGTAPGGSVPSSQMTISR